MGSIGDAYDNSAAESFFGTLQLELLDEHHWNTRRELAQAIFEWVECWYNPKRRHSSAPSTTKPASSLLKLRHDHHNQPVRRNGGCSEGHRGP